MIIIHNNLKFSSFSRSLSVETFTFNAIFIHWWSWTVSSLLQFSYRKSHRRATPLVDQPLLVTKLDCCDRSVAAGSKLKTLVGDQLIDGGGIHDHFPTLMLLLLPQVVALRCGWVDWSISESLTPILSCHDQWRFASSLTPTHTCASVIRCHGCFSYVKLQDHIAMWMRHRSFLLSSWSWSMSWSTEEWTGLLRITFIAGFIISLL